MRMQKQIIQSDKQKILVIWGTFNCLNPASKFGHVLMGEHLSKIADLQAHSGLVDLLFSTKRFGVEGKKGVDQEPWGTTVN